MQFIFFLFVVFAFDVISKRFFVQSKTPKFSSYCQADYKVQFSHLGRWPIFSVILFMMQREGSSLIALKHGYPYMPASLGEKINISLLNGLRTLDIVS